nr:hypothetical protein [Tanacetum cinerariifolium]
MQKIEEKVDTSKALDASLVDTESNIRPIYDEEPMLEVQKTAKINVFATGQQHTEQPEFNNEREPHRNESVIRQPTAFKSERPRISKPRFVSQVDVNKDLSKPVTTHYLPKEKDVAFAKPHHMIAPCSSRYSSNDMVHNNYLDEAKKKTQESVRTSNPSVMPSVRSKSIVNEHPRNSGNFSDSKHFVCSTCQKCVFNANHDSYVTKLLNKVNSRAKVPSNKTTNRNKPIEQTSFAKKPERQILKGHRFSIKKTFVVHEKIMTPGSYLRWKPMGKIFKTVGLRNQDSRRLLASFQDDAKHDHVGQDTKSQGGKDDQDKQGKDLEISEQKQNRKTMTKDKDQRSQSVKLRIYKKPHFKEDYWSQDNESNKKAWNLQKPSLRGDYGLKTFADTHNMIAYLTKSDASEGFNQIIDFLNTSSIKYALTINPNIYVSCIEQFWTSVFVKKVNDVTRLQAIVDKKRVIITEATIRDSLRLADAEGIDRRNLTRG